MDHRHADREKRSERSEGLCACGLSTGAMGVAGDIAPQRKEPPGRDLRRGPGLWLSLFCGQRTFANLGVRRRVVHRWLLLLWTVLRGVIHIAPLCSTLFRPGGRANGDVDERRRTDARSPCGSQSCSSDLWCQGQGCSLPPPWRGAAGRAGQDAARTDGSSTPNPGRRRREPPLT